MAPPKTEHGAAGWLVRIGPVVGALVIALLVALVLLAKR